MATLATSEGEHNDKKPSNCVSNWVSNLNFCRLLGCVLYGSDETVGPRPTEVLQTPLERLNLHAPACMQQ